MKHYTSLRAASRRQAMDWSLVLASQGIFCTLEFDPAEKRWLLLVAEDELARAEESIRRFRLENRHRFRLWSRKTPGQWELFPAACWSVILSIAYAAQWAHDGWLGEKGALDSASFWQGEWWRPFTAVFFHADLLHLSSNLTFGFILLAAAMGLYGPFRALLAAYLSAVIANLILLLFRSSPYVGLGSSGLVMAALGLLAANALCQAGGFSRGSGAWRQPFYGAFLLFALWGTSPRSDVWAHLLGLIFGLLLGLVLSRPAWPARKVEKYPGKFGPA